MTTVALPQLHGSGLLTHSRMSCFKQCPRKHYYRYELGLRKSDDARPLRMGSAVHLGLDMRAQGFSIDETVDTAIAGYAEVPQWAAHDDEKLHEWLVERVTVEKLLRGYFWYWENAQVPPELHVAEIVESEKSFDLPIKNPETGATTSVFRVGGKRDKIVWLGDGRLAVMEHKTTGDDVGPDSDYWKRLRLDQQISLYVVAARDQGHDVSTVLYDVIRKPSISPRQIPLLDADGVKIVLDAAGNRVMLANGKKWRESGDSEKGYVLQSRVETDKEFGDRLMLDIADRPEFYFQRREIPRLESDLAEFRAELWQQQQAIRESARNRRHFRNTAACIAPYRCEYLDMCGGSIDTENVPAGFAFVTELHPELAGE